MSASEKYLSSGEFAKLCKISKNTINWYEKMGLLKPKVIAENGYRYYSVEQFFDIDLVKTLKYADNSLSDCKDYLNYRNEKRFSAMMFKQQEVLESKIKTLSLHKKNIDMTLHCYYYDRDLYQEEPFVTELNNMWLLTYPIEKNEQKGYVHALRKCYDLYHSSAKIYDIACSLLNVTIVNVNDIMKGNYLHRSAVALRINSPIPDEKCRKIPAGKYALCAHIGELSNIRASYEKLLMYIRNTHFEIAGDSIEFDIINHLISRNPVTYQKGIAIPVR